VIEGYPVTVGWRRIVVGLVVVAAAGAYGGMPSQAATASEPGMILGHVPRAPAPMSATIVIGKGAATRGYQTKVVTISQGGTLSVVNEDTIEHTVTSVTACEPRPRTSLTYSQPRQGMAAARLGTLADAK
jgi:hypothetical protein